jgi:TRAP-type C4-dicarboxylate transport system permease small subunit
MRRFLNFIYDATGYLAAFFVFAIFAVMIAQTIMRELGLRTGGTDDIVAWMCAASAFLAMAETFKRGDFVRVGLMLEYLGPRARHAFEIWSLAVASAFIGYLAFWACRFTYESWQFNDMANGLIVIPMWIPQLSFVVGALVLFVAVADEFIIVLRGDRPTYVTAVEERHARGDFSEDV